MSESAESTTLGAAAEAPSGESTEPTITGYQSMVQNLEPTLSANPNISRHENFDSMAKEYVNLVSKIGEKGVIPPKEGDALDRNRFYNELGRPESAAEYNFGEWNPPEGWNDQVGMEMLQSMWDQGLTQDQAPAIVQKFAEVQQRQVAELEQASVQANQETVSTLKAELGSAYEERMNLAYRAVAENFGAENADEVLSMRLQNGVQLGDWMPFVKAMMKASDSVKEHDLVQDPTKATLGAKTPAEAQQEMDSLMADPDFKEAYLNSQHPNHKMALMKMDELYSYKGSTGSAATVGVGPGVNMSFTGSGSHE